MGCARRWLATSCVLAFALPMAAWGQATTPRSLADDAAMDATPAQIATEWELSGLYASVDDWDAAREAVLAGLDDIQARRDTFGDSAATVADTYDAVSDLSLNAYRVYTYTSLKADEDLRDAEALGRRGAAQHMFSTFAQAVSWISPAVQELGEDVIEAYIAEEPRLEKHAVDLRDTLRRARHTLDARGERLLAGAALPLSGAQRVYSQLMNSDIPWPTITLSTGDEVRLNSQGYVQGRTAPNRDDRIAVFEAFYSAFDQFESTLGETLNTHVQGQVFDARERGYDNALQAALSDDNLPEAVYRTLVQEVNAALPTLHRYMKLRERMMGVDHIAYHDIYPDLVTTDEEFSLERAAEITVAATEPLGAEYGEKLTDAIYNQSWMHVYPSDGKRSGAYMSGWVYDANPFVLLNHQDTYESVSTFAHEWGHALHTMLSNEAQPFETARYSIFVAETAAITNEMLAQEMMVRNAETDDERLFFLGYALEQMRATYFRQTQFAEFELAIHEEVEAGQPLTGERLTEMYYDIVKRYYGADEGVTEIPELYALEWAYIPHFYYDFYVFQYSTSIAAAAYYTEKILAGDEDVLEKYMTMLRAGGSDYPYDLKLATGLDMASPEPYRAIAARMNRIMDEIETILDSRDL